MIALLSMNLKAQQPFKDFEKEKTYIQTSHVFYKPGETMYFKIYTVRAENNLPADQSRVVNFELIDPSGSVISKNKYEITNGWAEGDVYFSEDMKGGIYKIRAFTNWMQNEQGKNTFEKEITLQKIVSPRILMKLDFPKKGYGAGDEVTADFSMRSLANMPIPFQEAYYTVMHNGEKVKEGKLITDKEGKNQLNFVLPEVLTSSDALLNIKVIFDGFTESISRNIPVVLNKLDVKLMPEGGTFINGLEQNIAFKITDEFEKPVDAVLEIYNQQHRKVAEASAYKFGMGNFILMPEKGQTYYAKVTRPENISQTYPLPAAQDEGIVFNIRKEGPKIVFIITSTESRKVVLKGSFREKETYNQSFSLQKGVNRFDISENELPAGISRFTVFEDEHPLAERIVFTNEDRQMNVKIKPVKKNSLPREKVVLDIETTDHTGKPVPANLAMSVVDDKLWTYADDQQNHILSWLLMDSELKGKIEKPQFYFDKKEEKAKKSLDLVMLTNGYRYFELTPEIISSQKYKYLPEKKNPIYGIVEDENGKPVKAEVYLTEGNRVLRQETSREGTFYFSDLKKEYDYKLIAKSFQPKQQVKIRILSYKLPVNPLAKKSLNHVNVEEVVKESLKEAGTIKLKEVDQPKQTYTEISTPSRSRPERPSRSSRYKSDSIGSPKIEEVVVLGYNYGKKKDVTGSVVNINTKELSNPDLASAVSGKVAGLMVTHSNGQPGSMVNLRIRGVSSISNKTPLYIVDGVPVENFKTIINPNDINSVTILKDAVATSVYGSRGVNGVVLINSVKNKRSEFTVDITPKTYYAVMNVRSDSLLSYSYSRSFSYPVYSNTNTQYRFDYRETLYWNPVVETDKNGKARVEFYNSDANSAFRILTEGISGTGQIGRDETTYAVQSLIAIDAKIPQYLTRTDQMTIPVVIKNNSSETRTMKLDVIVPNRVRLMTFESIITLKPLESGRILVRMQTDDVISSNIQFAVQSGDFRETAIFPFQVEEKGFPHYYSLISNKTENIQRDIPDYINGSFSSSYMVFVNTALQLFEDLERLKREPYGCFEQLSSTVYPNIFILDYLKAIERITPETQALVIRNMKKGFQKMLAYKGRDGGFGYFNSSESDAAVSAFALLEFKDLKKYVGIDQRIIQNLTSFILSKKTGNGTFEVRKSYEMSRPFTEHAWSRNSYVIYALSKSGIKEGLDEVYKTALNKAKATGDSYQLALMANAAFYLQKEIDYRELMTLLNQQYEKDKLKTPTTFTGSEGLSAKAETLSLYIMAMQKDEKQNQVQIAEAVDKLINYNGYYGFGSTQATTLALEALSGFFAKNEKLYGSLKPVVTINGTKTQPDVSLASAYRTGQNEIKIDYEGSIRKGLPYKLEYQYYTLQAPESKDIPVTLETRLNPEILKVGETGRMTVNVKNKINGPLPMVTAKIGIPAGLTLQNALLKDLIDKKQISYYEIFDNYLVLYWEHFDPQETKTVNLDLKVEFAGEYTGKSSNVYMYYMPEAKFWNQGITARIEY
jgi:TonB-dependent SusC/RagA subfamily outer membrane receptor